MPTRGRSRWSSPRLRRESARGGYQQHLAGVSGEEVDRFVDLAERHAVRDQPLQVEPGGLIVAGLLSFDDAAALAEARGCRVLNAAMNAYGST